MLLSNCKVSVSEDPFPCNLNDTNPTAQANYNWSSQFFRDDYFAENVNKVVSFNGFPGRTTIEGKFLWWMASGKCCVSRQTAV